MEWASRRSKDKGLPGRCGAGRSDAPRSRPKTAPAGCRPPRRGAPLRTPGKRRPGGWNTYTSSWSCSLPLMPIYAIARAQVPGLHPRRRTPILPCAAGRCDLDYYARPARVAGPPTGEHGGSDSIISAMEIKNATAAASGTFSIAGRLPVHRLGYGTMRLVGDGAWGEPSDAGETRRVLRRAVELGVTL